MTQIELLDTIRNEIERRIKNWHCTEFVDEMREGPNGDDGLLAFLDTLQEPSKEPVKARVKKSGKIVEGFLDGKGHFDVPVDHDIFDRYDIDELVFAPLQEPDVDLEKEIEEYWIATGWSKVMTLGKFKVIARYFYGLGQLNAK